MVTKLMHHLVKTVFADVDCVQFLCIDDCSQLFPQSGHSQIEHLNTQRTLTISIYVPISGLLGYILYSKYINIQNWVEKSRVK